MPLRLNFMYIINLIENSEILLRKIQRERKAREAAERILEKKSLELYNANLKLENSNKTLKSIAEEKTLELESFIEIMLDGYIIFDMFGNILKFNRAANELFALSQYESPNLKQLIYPPDRFVGYRHYLSLLKEKRLFNSEIRIIDRNGKIHWIQVNTNLLEDKDSNQPLFALGVFRDITLAKQREKSFIEQRMQLDAIVDNSVLGIVLSQGSNLVKVNQSFSNLLGYSQEEFSNLKMEDITHADDLAASLIKNKELNEGLVNNFSIKKRYIAKSGLSIWANTTVSSFYLQEKKESFQVSLIENIEEELRNETFIKGINTLLQSFIGETDVVKLANGVCSGIIEFLDIEHCAFQIVDELEEISCLAYSGSVYGDFILEECVYVKDSIDEEVVRSKTYKIYNSEALKDNEKVDPKMNCRLSIPVIIDAKVKGIISSEHSKANFFTENHIKAFSTIARLVAIQLKSVVIMTDIITTNQENKSLVQELRLSNDELKDFAYAVSHDLKSPLRSMNTLINWIEEEFVKLDNAEGRDNFEHLYTKLDRMDQLIDDLLMYSRVDRGKMDNEEVDFNEVFYDLIETINVPEHIDVSLKSELPTMHISRVRIKQVFQNLLSNAIKYCDKDPGFVSVSCTEEPSHYVFCIRDNGKGIDSIYFKKIFQIFQTLEKSESSTGIGLSIVKKIIDYYDGKVWVNSILGSGSVFCFSLSKNIDSND
jgi:PAS domain S-box-containing protein